MNPGPAPILRDELHIVPGRISTKLARWVDGLWAHKRTVWFILAFGCIARIGQYVSNRALWSDEALLTLNILERSYSGLTNTLANYQYAPIGFLWVERFLVDSLGPGEYVLRLFPLACSLLSMSLFVMIARQTLTHEAANFAAAFFALSDNLIYYASEVKQYSTDTSVTLALFWCALWLMRKKTGLAFVTFALMGAVFVWLSHPAVFVLAGIGLSVFFHFLIRRDWQNVLAISLTIALWMVSFAFEYFVFLREPTMSLGLRGSFAASFLPAPGSLRELYGYPKLFFLMFFESLGFPLMGIAALLFFLGFPALWRQRSAGSWLTLPPILVTLGVSFLNVYPFRGRLIVFLIPLVVVLMGAGAGLLWTRLRFTSPVIALTCMGLAFFHPVSLAAYHLVKPRLRVELRQVMEQARSLIQPGDVVYVHFDAWAAYQYYSRYRGLLGDIPVIGGSLDRKFVEFQAAPEQLRGRRRIWFVFSYPGVWPMEHHKPILEAHLKWLGGKKVRELEIANEMQKSFERYRSSASLVLFEFPEGGPVFPDLPEMAPARAH